MATKKFCDACGEEIVGTVYDLTLEGDGSIHKNDKESWDLCFPCAEEIPIFVRELCKLHMLYQTRKAVNNLEL